MVERCNMVNLGEEGEERKKDKKWKEKVINKKKIEKEENGEIKSVGMEKFIEKELLNRKIIKSFFS